jgi:hypothetical protein
MRTRVSRTLPATLIFWAVACGTPPDKASPPALANTGQVTVHVKDMTRRLNLV